MAGGAGARWLVYGERPQPTPKEIEQASFERFEQAAAPRCRGICGRPERKEPTAIAECGASGCTLELPEGTYRLAVEGSWEIVPRSHALIVDEDLDLEVRAPHRSVQWGGIALVIVGVPTLTLGMVDIIVAPLTSLSEDCTGHCATPREVALFGAGLVVAGGGSAALGAILFERNTRIRMRPARTGDAGARSVAFGLEALREGLGVAARVSF